MAASGVVPADLLFAIALAESGKKRLSGKLLPWPWTLNISGESHFFDTKFAAVRKAKAAINDGMDNVDIGLMQVNWRYHNHRFDDLASAFDAYINLEVGAAVLRDCFGRTKDWLTAASCYHAPSNPTRGQLYLERVETFLRMLSEGRSTHDTGVVKENP